MLEAISELQLVLAQIQDEEAQVMTLAQLAQQMLTALHGSHVAS